MHNSPARRKSSHPPCGTLSAIGEPVTHLQYNQLHSAMFIAEPETRSEHRLRTMPMHSFFVGATFLVMLLSPCLVAQCGAYFPIRVRIRWAASPAIKPAAKQEVYIRDPIVIREVPASRHSSRSVPIARSSRAA